MIPYNPCNLGNWGILLKDHFFFSQVFRYHTQTQMFNSNISCPKVPKLIITNLDLSFTLYLRMAITVVSSGWRGLWITGFQEVTSKVVITRNVQTTIIYNDLQRKSHWMSFPCVLQQSCCVILCMKLNSYFLFFCSVKSFFFNPTPKKVYLPQHLHQRQQKPWTVGINPPFLSGIIAITHSKWGLTKDKICLHV